MHRRRQLQSGGHTPPDTSPAPAGGAPDNPHPTETVDDANTTEDGGAAGCIGTSLSDGEAEGDRQEALQPTDEPPDAAPEAGVEAEPSANGSGYTGQGADSADSDERRSRDHANGIRHPSNEHQIVFQELAAKAMTLGPGDHEGGREIVRRAFTVRLPAGETAMLQEYVKATTGLPAAVVGPLANDAQCFVPGFGYLRTVPDVASACAADFRRRYDRVVSVGGKTFVYAAAASEHTTAAEAGHYRAVKDALLIRRMLELFGQLPILQRPARRREVLELLHAEFSCDEDFFAEAPPGLCMENGFLRVDPVTGEPMLEPHSHEQRASYRLPFAFDPDAEAPRFNNGMLDMLEEDGRKIEAVLQTMFCAMFRHRPHADPVRTVLVLQGAPGSGKSTLAQLIGRFLPSEVQSSIPPDKWSDGYYLERLRGVLLNTVTELDTDAGPISGAVFKLVASGEPVTARQIRQRPVTFRPQAIHVFTCNNLPRIGECGPSLDRRLTVVEVPDPPEGFRPDARFLDEVWAEAPGIINLLIREARTMIETGRFTLPDDNRELIVRMQAPDDPVEQVARLWVERAPGERVASEELQLALRLAAETMSIDTRSWSSNKGMKSLAERIGRLHGAARRVVGGAVFYEGVRFAERYAGLIAPGVAAA